MNQMKSTIPMQPKPMMREALAAAEAAAPLPPNLARHCRKNPRGFPRDHRRCSACRPYFYDGGLMPKHFYEDKRVAPEDRRPAGIAGLATMIMYGAELGLSPMQTMRMMHVIEGRPYCLPGLRRFDQAIAEMRLLPRCRGIGRALCLRNVATHG